MTLEERADARNAVGNSRRAPTPTSSITVAFSDGGCLNTEPGPGAIELTVEATNADSQLAAWLTDDWWATLIQFWADRAVIIHIAPTPGALLNPVVAYQLVMLRRVVPNWRLVGHAYVDDVITDEAVTEVAGSCYHEIRFLDRARAEPSPSDRCSWAPALDELFGRIRKEQTRLGKVTPILVRLPLGRTPAKIDTSPPTHALADVPAPAVETNP